MFKSHSKEVLELSLAMIELGLNLRAIGGDEPVSERWDLGDSCEYQGVWMEVRGPNKMHLYEWVQVCVHVCICVHVCVNVESPENICQNVYSDALSGQ